MRSKEEHMNTHTNVHNIMLLHGQELLFKLNGILFFCFVFSVHLFKDKAVIIQFFTWPTVYNCDSLLLFIVMYSVLVSTEAVLKTKLINVQWDIITNCRDCVSW